MVTRRQLSAKGESGCMEIVIREQESNPMPGIGEYLYQLTFE